MKKGGECGFSLMELMVVIAIIAITSAIAIPNMISWREGSKLQGVANNFMADLQMAKLRAIREAGRVAVVITASGYSVFVDNGPNLGEANNYTWDATEQRLRNVTLPAGVTIVNNTFPGSRTAFDLRGRPTNLGTLQFQNSAGTTKSVIVNQVGRIRVQ